MKGGAARGGGAGGGGGGGGAGAGAGAEAVARARAKARAAGSGAGASLAGLPVVDKSSPCAGLGIGTKAPCNGETASYCGAPSKIGVNSTTLLRMRVETS